MGFLYECVCVFMCVWCLLFLCILQILFFFFFFNDAHLHLVLSTDLGHWCPCLGVDPTLTAHQASAIPPDYTLPMTQM